jgi:hypothetical protein
MDIVHMRAYVLVCMLQWTANIYSLKLFVKSGKNVKMCYHGVMYTHDTCTSVVQVCFPSH